MATLGNVVGQRGDPRTWTLPAEAVALLEPLGPSPALAGALAEVVFVHALQGRPAEAIRVADRALGLAEELGLARPVRALGFRGMARAYLGDPGCLQDYREAIELATEAGQGREVALLHNNLGMALWGFHGPAASLQILREGLAPAKARGLTEQLNVLTGSTLNALVDMGEPNDALEVAAELAPRLEASGDVVNLIEVRAAQTRIFALRGQGAEVAELLDWLEPAARGTEDPQMVVCGLGSSALVRAELGQGEAVTALLIDVEACTGVRDNQQYPALLPAMVRTALRFEGLALAERLLSGLSPRYPYAEHSLTAANAALIEAHGDLRAAAEAYADAADRWERFGVVPEQGFALLGQGRCLLGLSRATEASPVLQHARETFERLQAAPALAETDALYEEAIAVTS